MGAIRSTRRSIARHQGIPWHRNPESLPLVAPLAPASKPRPDVVELPKPSLFQRLKSAVRSIFRRKV